MPRPRRFLTIPLPHRETVLITLVIALGLIIVALLADRQYQRVRLRELEEQEIVPNRQLTDEALNARVEKLLASMTLEEKIGQLAPIHRRAC